VSAVPGPVLPTRFTLYLAWMAIRAAPTSAGVEGRENRRRRKQGVLSERGVAGKTENESEW
jgi:hypothetical protein